MMKIEETKILDENIFKNEKIEIKNNIINNIIPEVKSISENTMEGTPISITFLCFLILKNVYEFIKITISNLLKKLYELKFILILLFLVCITIYIIYFNFMVWRFINLEPKNCDKSIRTHMDPKWNELLGKINYHEDLLKNNIDVYQNIDYYFHMIFSFCVGGVFVIFGTWIENKFFKKFKISKKE